MSTNENFADSNRARIAFVKEVVFGTTPNNPTMQIARITSSDLSVTKDTSTSDEIRNDRQVGDITPLSFSSGGSLNIEWSMLNFDAFLAAALGTDFTNGGNIQTNVSWTINTPSANQVTFTGSGLSGLTVATGDWVYISNTTFTGFFKVLSFVGTTLEVADPGGKIIANGSADSRLSSSCSLNGTTKMSFSIEQAYLDASAYQLFTGQRVGTWSLAIEAGARVTGAFGFQGLEVLNDTTEYGTTYLQPFETESINATTNVGMVLVNGAELGVCIQSINLELENGLREQRGIGNAYPCGIGLGRQVITGTLTAYFADFTLYDLFINHDNVSLIIPLFDNDGNGLLIELPRVKFNSDPIAPSGIDTDIIEEIEFGAVFDSEDGSTIRVCKHDNTAAATITLAGGTGLPSSPVPEE